MRNGRDTGARQKRDQNTANKQTNKQTEDTILIYILLRTFPINTLQFEIDFLVLLLLDRLSAEFSALNAINFDFISTLMWYWL